MPGWKLSCSRWSESGEDQPEYFLCRQMLCYQAGRLRLRSLADFLGWTLAEVCLSFVQVASGFELVESESGPTGPDGRVKVCSYSCTVSAGWSDGH